MKGILIIKKRTNVRFVMNQLRMIIVPEFVLVKEYEIKNKKRYI